MGDGNSTLHHDGWRPSNGTLSLSLTHLSRIVLLCFSILKLFHSLSLSRTRTHERRDQRRRGLDRRLHLRVGVERTTRRGRSLRGVDARVARRPERDLIRFGDVAAGVRQQAPQTAVRAAEHQAGRVPVESPNHP